MGSHGSAGSASSGSTHGSSNPTSHVDRPGSVASPAKVSRGVAVKEGKRGFFASLLHRKPHPTLPPETNIWPVPRCKKGQKCFGCWGGSRTTTGQCIYGSQFSCLAGQYWNGFSCSTRVWFDSCRALENELRALEQEMWERQMQGTVDPGLSLRHQELLDEYRECLRRCGSQTLGGSQIPCITRAGLFELQ